MVLDVPVARVYLLTVFTFLRLYPLGELVQHLLEGLAEHVCQDVEPPPVRHGEGNFLHAEFRGGVDHAEHSGNQGPAPIQAEPFGGGELPVQEILEHHRMSGPFQDLLLAFLVKPRAGGLLNVLQQPVAHFWVGDVAELVPDVATVQRFQLLHKGPDRLVDGHADHPVAFDGNDQSLDGIFRIEAVKLRRQAAKILRLVKAKGIQVRHSVPQVLKALHHRQHS
mmetsp:Transcript_14323/g.40725  ORF Transcript_14323/g.40725 Transcript_14323/m.40725 type:complete len:223 (-) Transcript_14323:540-1208(-)